jgi:Flp pilus assembly pilin Flp
MTKMMKTAKETFSRLLREEEAATAVEYAIIAALVGVALIASLTEFREAIKTMLTEAAESITSN